MMELSYVVIGFYLFIWNFMSFLIVYFIYFHELFYAFKKAF